MSDTPLTDAARFAPASGPYAMVVDADFARSLERRLAEVTAQFEWITSNIEDMQIGDVDPTQYMTDGATWPQAWAAAIRAMK